MKNTTEMIDLGQKYDIKALGPAGSTDKKVSYPTLFIRGVPELDLPMGDFTFTAKGKVVVCTEREEEGKPETCDYEIEVHSINPGTSGKAPASKKVEVELGEALDKMQMDKEMDEEDD
jgi:hypothetical protein